MGAGNESLLVPFLEQGLLGLIIVLVVTAWLREWVISQRRHKEALAAKDLQIQLLEKSHAAALLAFQERFDDVCSERDQWQEVSFSLLPLADNAVTVLQEVMVPEDAHKPTPKHTRRQQGARHVED